MENPTARQSDPVLLALRRTDGEPSALETSASSLQQLHLIETACTPRVEVDLLVDLLARGCGLAQSLADPTEVHNYHHPLASMNGYKHRMHALRREYVNLRLRNEDLEKRLHFLEATLEQMRASRGWKCLDQCSRWRRSAWRWFQRLYRSAPSKAGEPAA